MAPNWRQIGAGRDYCDFYMGDIAGDSDNNKKKGDQLNVFYALSLAWQMGFLIIAPILLFLFGGYMIDKWLKTAPLFIIISIFAALAVSVYEIHHLIKPMLESSRKELEEFTGEKKNNQN